jgi:hypothetical protein
MADYYPILALAVSRLATNNAQARQSVYEYARKFIVAHMDRCDPQRSADEIISEWIAFETAVREVETKSQSSQGSHEPLKNRLDALRELQGKNEPVSENGKVELVPDFAPLLHEVAEPPHQSAPAV